MEYVYPLENLFYEWAVDVCELRTTEENQQYYGSGNGEEMFSASWELHGNLPIEMLSSELKVMIHPFWLAIVYAIKVQSSICHAIE